MRTISSKFAAVVVLGMLVGALPKSVALTKKKQPPIRPQLVRDALDNNRDLFYFGLGSNMSRKKLENRGINGTRIDVKSFEAAVVPNYRLAFNMRGFPPIEPGMGSLEPSHSRAKALLTYKENECHGALVKLTAENYKKVMASEGVGNPNNKIRQGYEEIIVDAYPYGRSKKPVKAVALRARPHVRLNFDPSPSERYMNILREGAEELNLKVCYQEFLAQHPIQRVPKWRKKYVVYNLVFNRFFGRRFLFVQSRLLFLFYAPGSAPTLVRLFSDSISNLILLPGFLIGFLFSKVAGLFGKAPAFVTQMMTMLGASD